MKSAIILIAVLLGLYTCAGSDEKPECDIAFHPDGTWSPEGWDPFFDGYGNCQLPTEYGGHPVIVQNNQTWRYK